MQQMKGRRGVEHVCMDDDDGRENASEEHATRRDGVEKLLASIIIEWCTWRLAARTCCSEMPSRFPGDTARRLSLMGDERACQRGGMKWSAACIRTDVGICLRTSLYPGGMILLRELLALFRWHLSRSAMRWTDHTNKDSLRGPPDTRNTFAEPRRTLLTNRFLSRR